MLDYTILRDIQRKETDSAAIVALVNSFYSEAAGLLAEKKKTARESGTILAIKEYENLRRIIAVIQAKREEKIVLMAVRGERDAAGLTSEESALLRDLSDRVTAHRAGVSDVWNGKETGAPDARKVRILKDIEPYTGLDKTVYGPFRSGEERILPQPEAVWLLKSGLAEQL